MLFDFAKKLSSNFLSACLSDSFTASPLPLAVIWVSVPSTRASVEPAIVLTPTETPAETPAPPACTRPTRSLTASSDCAAIMTCLSAVIFAPLSTLAVVFPVSTFTPTEPAMPVAVDAAPPAPMVMMSLLESAARDRLPTFRVPPEISASASLLSLSTATAAPTEAVPLTAITSAVL